MFLLAAFIYIILALLFYALSHEVFYLQKVDRKGKESFSIKRYRIWKRSVARSLMSAVTFERNNDVISIHDPSNENIIVSAVYLHQRECRFILVLLLSHSATRKSIYRVKRQIYCSTLWTMRLLYVKRGTYVCGARNTARYIISRIY